MVTHVFKIYILNKYTQIKVYSALDLKLSGKFERISFLLVFKIAAVKDGVCFSPVYFVNTVGSIF